MAEEPSDPTPEGAHSQRSHEYWHQRIQNYIASGKAAQHVQEGFQGFGSPFLDLQGFKDRESRRKRPQDGQGQLRQGGASGQEALDPVKEWLRDEDEDEADKICIWCGKVCVGDLDAHEAECEP